MTVIGPLLRELDRAAGADEGRRTLMLEKIADLYLGQGTDLQTEAVDLFDEVLVRLATEIARRARVELSRRLADAQRGPPRLVRQLVHDEVEVARPLIERGSMVSEDDLLSVAMTRGDEHRQIVASRPHITEKVTEALVDRGGPPVLRRVAANSTAAISTMGFDKLVARAGGDEMLQRLLSERKDLPIAQVHRLIDMAGAAAKARLQSVLANVDPKAVNAAVEGQVGRAHELAATATTRRSYEAAIALVSPLQKNGALNETHLRAFAEDKQFEQMVCGLSGLTRVSLKTIEAVFDAADTDRFLVLCKAMNFEWPT
ncbi:MAG: DUF2336 domain-containing protein, partial [Beijerinckiaceae bacterium]